MFKLRRFKKNTCAGFTQVSQIKILHFQNELLSTYAGRNFEENFLVDQFNHSNGFCSQT